MKSNPYMTIDMQDGILHCVFADHLEMDLEIARACVAQRIEFSEGQSYPCLIDMRGLRSISKPAREHLSSQGSLLIRAGALLVHSPLSSMLANIFLTIQRPKVPTRMFANEASALEWLQKYKMA